MIIDVCTGDRPKIVHSFYDGSGLAGDGNNFNCPVRMFYIAGLVGINNGPGYIPESVQRVCSNSRQLVLHPELFQITQVCEKRACICGESRDDQAVIADVLWPNVGEYRVAAVAEEVTIPAPSLSSLEMKVPTISPSLLIADAVMNVMPATANSGKVA